MPPRYAYWTILLGDEPTSFRSGSQEDLMPTFKRLQQKHPSARMMWFQNGKLWPSRLDAQEAMRARGEMGRRSDSRQGGFRDRPNRDDRGKAGRPFVGRQDDREERDPSGKLAWSPKTSRPQDPRTPRPQAPKTPRPQDPKTSGSGKLAWQPKGTAPRGDRPAWKKPDDRRPKWTGKPSFKRPPAPRGSSAPRSEKLEWRPKGEGSSSRPQDPRTLRPQDPRTPRPQDPRTLRPQDPRTPRPQKRSWVPKEEYKRSQGIEAKKDKNWRPGGDHKDPRQKYKDAKKAKWTRFKQTVRKRWEGKPGRKKKDG